MCNSKITGPGPSKPVPVLETLPEGELQNASSGSADALAGERKCSSLSVQSYELLLTADQQECPVAVHILQIPCDILLVQVKWQRGSFKGREGRGGDGSEHKR